MIEVEKKNVDEFLVIVNEKGPKTEYKVQLENEYYQKLTKGNITKEELIKRSFRFLLGKESKESIFSKFNLRIIENYFPEYEGEIKAV